MTHGKNVPKATKQRYPIYLKALRKLKSNNVEEFYQASFQSW